VLSLSDKEYALKQPKLQLYSTIDAINTQYVNSYVTIIHRYHKQMKVKRSSCALHCTAFCDGLNRMLVVCSSALLELLSLNVHEPMCVKLYIVPRQTRIIMYSSALFPCIKETFIIFIAGFLTVT